MQYRTFGRTGWEVSEIGYGMWGMADFTDFPTGAAKRSVLHLRFLI